MDNSMMSLLSSLHSVVSVLMLLVLLAAIAAAVFRFRATASGFILAVSFGGFALLRIISMVVGSGGENDWILSAVVGVLNFGLALVLAVGIGLIPRSLRALSASSTAGPATAAPGVRAPALGPGVASGIPATKSDDFARILAASDHSFDQISRAMASLDAQMQGVPGEEVAPGEPGAASWASGSIQVQYTFDRRTGLRMLELRGPQARFLLNDLLNVVYMPTLEGYKVSTLLTSSDSRELLQGICAAEFIGVCGDQRFYVNPVSALTSHADPGIATEARRVLAVLNSR
jgi:hypothetical protein